MNRFIRHVVPLAATALCVPASPQGISATNPSGYEHSTWISVPIPYRDAQALPEHARFVTTDGRSFGAIRGTTVGVHTQFYDVCVPFRAAEHLRGRMRLASQPSQLHFNLSPWIGDDISRVLPRFVVREGATEHRAESETFELEFGSAAQQLWKRTTRCGPLVFEYWIRFFSGQDVVEWELLAVHSDPRSPRVEVTVDSIVAEFGELPVLDDFRALGLAPARFDAARGVWALDLIPHRVTLGDAEGLPLFSGALLCIDNTVPLSALISSNDPRTRGRLVNLCARIPGRPRVTRNWRHRWLAFQATVPPHPNDAAVLAQRLGRDASDMDGTLGFFGDRWRGLHPAAGSTGAQFDFAVSKGAELTLRDDRFAASFRFALEEPFRPCHYREADGAPVLKANHPNWWTWSQTTHWHCVVSPSRLGKPCPVPRHGGTFFSGKDDQHKSSNHLLACVAHFDWPSARALLRDEVEVALANVRRRHDQGAGAARAFGRRMLADANAFMLTGREDVWSGLIMDLVAKNTRPLRSDPRLPLRPYDVVVDPRVIPDVPAIMVWQQGLCLTGLCAAWSAHRYRQSIGRPTHRNTDRLEAMIQALATTLVRLFRKDDDGDWYTFLSVAYRDGYGPGEAAMERATPGLTEGWTGLGSTWMEWTLPGLYYLARADHGISLPDLETWALADIAAEFDRRIGIQESLESREWYAVVERAGPRE